MVGRLLRSLSEAIDAFAEVGGSADVILVDSTPGLHARRVEALAEAHRARVLRAANDVRRKRNLGIRSARGDVVLFLDSDCEADRRLLVEHALAHRVESAPDARPVGGVLGVVTLVGESTAAWRAADAAGFCDSFDFARRYPQAEWGPCANISYRRDALVSLGGFREDWPRRLGGDDVELGMRVNASGFAILCWPRAVVRHDRRTWAQWSAVVERAWRWGAMDLHVRMAVPHSRLVPAGAGPDVYTAVVALAGVVVAARRRQATPLVRALLVLPCALVVGRPPAVPLVPRLSGEALRLLFAVAALAEAVRVRRLRLAFVALVPLERTAAARRARRRTVVTIAGLIVTLPWVMLEPSTASRARACASWRAWGSRRQSCVGA